MIIPKRFLITIHFDRIFMPDGIERQNNAIRDFLHDVSLLARQAGVRLFAEYSIVRGCSGVHAHIITNWMPIKRLNSFRHPVCKSRIHREPIMRLMGEHYFMVSNPPERIKRIKSNPDKVQRYIYEQSKGEQVVLFAGVFHPEFVPVYSEVKIQFYYSRPSFQALSKSAKFGCLYKLFMISCLLIGKIFLISYLSGFI